MPNKPTAAGKIATIEALNVIFKEKYSGDWLDLLDPKGMAKRELKKSFAQDLEDLINEED